MSMSYDLKDFNLFNEGQGYIGQVSMGKTPKLSRKMDEFIAAGMVAPVKIAQHLEVLEMEWGVRGFDPTPYRQFGRINLGDIGLRFSGAYQRPDTGDVDAIDVIVRGIHEEIDPGDAKRGEAGETKVKTTLSYYELIKNGERLVRIDVMNGIEEYGGVDLNAAIRQALGA